MKVQRKGTGEIYTPFNHFGMTTQVFFNPDNGSKKANVTLSTVKGGAGSVDEVHENSDQILVVMTGEATVMSEGVLVDKLYEGDALLISAGDIHAVVNNSEEDCSYICITVPPLNKTH